MEIFFGCRRNKGYRHSWPWGGRAVGELGATAFGYAPNVWNMRDFDMLADQIIRHVLLGGMTMIVMGMQVLTKGLGILEIPTGRLEPSSETVDR